MIGLVDEFIIYDEVQYTKNDWRNRNKIKTAQGVQWLTIPVYQKNLHQKISETEVSDKKWNIKHWNTLVTNYGRAPHFKTGSAVFEEFYKTVTTPNLSEINTTLIQTICRLLGMPTKITHSSAYVLEGDPTARLVNLCKQTQSLCYLSGPAAKSYLQEDMFASEGIEVQWMDYSNYPEYPQLFPPFEHGVSILDLLFNTGPESIHYMKWSKP